MHIDETTKGLAPSVADVVHSSGGGVPGVGVAWTAFHVSVACRSFTIESRVESFSRPRTASRLVPLAQPASAAVAAKKPAVSKKRRRVERLLVSIPPAG
jgi:hypothetical protein